MRYCDIHTHILPKIDDGAKSVSETVKLIQNLNRYGVDAIAFTPHYYSNKQPIEEFLRRRNLIFNHIKDVLPDNVTYTLGAEVFVTDLFFGNDDVSPLCYYGTKYMLTEFSYNITLEQALERIDMIISRYSVIPIIAHIERYPKLLSTICLEKLISCGARIQINIDCLTGLVQKSKMLNLIRNELVHYIATDTHSLERRCPDFMDNAQKIVKLGGKEFFKDCMLRAQDLFVM